MMPLWRLTGKEIAGRRTRRERVGAGASCGGDGKDNGQYLIDIKAAGASALAANIGVPQPHWRSEAERVVLPFTSVSVNALAVAAVTGLMSGGFAQHVFRRKHEEPGPAV